MSLDIKSHINQYMVATDPASINSTDSVKALIKEIETNKITLLNFIKVMGDYLTEDSNSIRTKALSLLSSVLQDMNKKKLFGQDIQVLMDFYLSKLSDEPCIKETLAGLNSLVLMNQFSPVLINKLLTSVKKDFTPKGQLASTRFLGFQILKSILTCHLDYCIANLNELIIKSYLHLSKNEKDPKNLLISFELNTIVSSKFDIREYNEELFDSVFCYFPISFRAPENDPYKITGDQLKQGLRDCLSANDLYAKDSFPNLIEKLSSPSPNVKLDVLKTINQCVSLYATETIKSYWISLWNSLKFEILHHEIASAKDLNALMKYYESAESEDERVIPIVLTIFKSLGEKYSNNNKDETLQDYLILIVDELAKFLKDPTDAKSKQSTIILAAICSSNLSVYNLLIPKVMPLLLSSTNGSETNISIKNQRMLMTNVSFILDSYYKLFNEDKLKIEDTNPMFEYKDNILMMINQSLLATSKLEVSIRCLAITLIAKLFTLNSFLKTQECQLIAQSLTEVLSEDNNATTFGQTLNTLNSISKEYPEVILEFTVPKLLVLLPDTDSTEELNGIQPVHTKEKVFETFLSICENKLIVDSLLIRLLNKLEILLSNGASKSYIRLLLLNLSKVLNKLTDSDSSDDYMKKFVPKFLYIIINEICFNQDSAIYKDEISLEYSGRSMKKLIINYDLTLHPVLIEKVFALFFKGEHETSLLYKSLPESINLFENNFILYSLFSKMLAAIKSPKLPIDEYEFVDCLLITLNKQSTLVERQSTLQTISLVVNKWFSGVASETYLNDKFDKLTSIISDPNTPKLTKLKDLETITWITKALIMKNDKLGDKFQLYLVSLLESTEFAAITPKILEVLVADLPCFDSFKKVGPLGKPVVFNVNIRLLYKQKFFNSTLPTLIAKYKENPTNKNYLTALSLILKYVDKTVILPHLESILPLILTSLSLKSDLIVASSLSILRIAIDETPDLITRQLSTIIPNLIQLLNSNRNEEVKSRALECLISLSDFELHLMVPYRLSIINGLVTVLDDEKRIVRKIASDCRQVYYELGQPKAEVG
ncbi:hypothetical protein CANARDRAFT_29352 [[Candida] arabinofermentans NRRL YB-2248]|uniref:MMS19 nucleotide excision repair protein n=1 Tax=[Candida] arabinofermentans NRRL YB-2248 TaxID=983967 RepID=A0A1E4SXI0_9ASCO|nr:hypothetical protein CANARDRAFT_29352 [[Candida] arabinofermentans NRRL YB-2248]